MDKKLFEAHSSFLAEFVSKVKNQNSGSFRMKYELSSAYCYHFQFIRVPVGNAGCSYIYGHCEKSESAINQLDLPLKVYAIVNEENIFFTLYASQFGLSYWNDDEWAQFSEMVGMKAHYFPHWCNRFRETFTANILDPFYESLSDLPELSLDEQDECLDDARNYVVYGSCGSLKEFSFPLASREILAQKLCGLDEPFRAYKAHCLKDMVGSMKKHKALRNHTLSLIETQAGFAPWELDMADALKDMNPDSQLKVFFSFEGKKDSARMKVREVRKELSRRGVFFDSSFFNHKEGREVIKTLTGFRDRLTPKHIVKIVHGTKVLYEKTV